MEWNRVIAKKLNLGSVWNTLTSFSRRARFVVLAGNYHPVGFEFRVRRIDHAYSTCTLFLLKLKLVQRKMYTTFFYLSCTLYFIISLKVFKYIKRVRVVSDSMLQNICLITSSNTRLCTLLRVTVKSGPATIVIIGVEFSVAHWNFHGLASMFFGVFESSWAPGFDERFSLIKYTLVLRHEIHIKVALCVN